MLMTRFAGRHDKRLIEFTCADSILQPFHTSHGLRGSTHQACDMVLWYVDALARSTTQLCSMSAWRLTDYSLISGSSRGRGSRAAAWFRDHIEAEGKSSTVQSVILEGGIKGWVAGGEEFTEMMEGYDGAAWSA